MIEKVKGNLITLALQGEFDVIAHGVNCFNRQKSGLAPQLVKHFKTDSFPMELCREGDYNKLGCIDWMNYSLVKHPKYGVCPYRQDEILYSLPNLTVVNCYSQYYYLGNRPNTNVPPIDYVAFTMCLKKINEIFKGKHIGLPYIGAGLAGGTKGMFELLVEQWMKDCKVTLAEYDNK